MPASNGFHDGFLDLPARPGKPRTEGLTHVIDKGLGIRDIEQLFDTAGAFVDIVKLGWGTAYITNNLEKKIAVYRSFETPVVCGGTLFEVVYARDRLDEYKSWLVEHRFGHVEISDGTIDIPRDRKLELIADFARDFTVLSEVGSKDAEVVYAPYQWVEWIKEELEAGAWKVVTEGREGGTAGLYRPTGEMRTGLVDEIVHEIPVSDLIFEAPTKSSQAWFVKRFGPNVNVGNIPPDEVIPLETLRLGLRGDTLKEVLLGGEPAQLPELDWEAMEAPEIIGGLLEAFPGRVSLACSFQKEESVLLDMLYTIAPDARVFALDTHVLFPETYAVWRAVEERYKTKVEIYEGPTLAKQAEIHGEALWERKPDLCCAIRKVEPLGRALGGLDAWITGLRRDQSPTRANAPKMGWDETHELWKANPLADWDDQRCWDYIRDRDLPYNELHDDGYASIGCTHCTQPGSGREGRWASADKTECGLHVVEQKNG